MPRSKEANQQIREEQREKILEGALRAFSRKGMSATMSDVAQATGVSQGLAYRYFDSKEALFNELVEKTIRISQESLKPVQEMPGTPVERLNFMITKSLESMHENIAVYRLLAQISDDELIPEVSLDLLNKFENNYREYLTQLIIEAQAAGEAARDDPEQLTKVILACLQGLLRIPDLEKSDNECPEVAIILRILKP